MEYSDSESDWSAAIEVARRYLQELQAGWTAASGRTALRAAVGEVEQMPPTAAGARRAVLLARLWFAKEHGDWLEAEVLASELASQPESDDEDR